MFHRNSTDSNDNFIEFSITFKENCVKDSESYCQLSEALTTSIVQSSTDENFTNETNSSQKMKKETIIKAKDCLPFEKLIIHAKCNP